MDVSELLAQKHNLRAERAASDEPELTLTERELDYRLRKAFADRERNVEKQVRKLLAAHMHEVESKIAEAVAGLPRALLTLADVEALVASKIVEHRDDKQMRPVTRAVIKGLVAGIRSEIQEQLGLFRADIEIAKAHAGDRGDVVEVPQFLERRRA